MEKLFPYAQRIDEHTWRLDKRLWVFYGPTKIYADPSERLPLLMEEEEGTEFDMIFLRKLELGPCYVFHGTKVLPPNTLQFRNEEATLKKCSCGKVRILCSNPLVQKCCDQ